MAAHEPAAAPGGSHEARGPPPVVVVSRAKTRLRHRECEPGGDHEEVSPPVTIAARRSKLATAVLTPTPASAPIQLA